MNGHSLFSNMVGDLVVFLVVYADDILVTVMNTKEIQSLRILINAQFKIKDLGDLHYFLILKLLENQMVFFWLNRNLPSIYLQSLVMLSKLF